MSYYTTELRCTLYMYFSYIIHVYLYNLYMYISKYKYMYIMYIVYMYMNMYLSGNGCCVNSGVRLAQLTHCLGGRERGRDAKHYLVLRHQGRQGIAGCTRRH